MVRGQLEIFAIIGLVVIGIVAIYYLFLSAPSAIPSESPAVPERLKHVQSWILNLLQEKLSENLRTLERQGGNFYPAADSPVYAGNPVAYWANCSSTAYPELQEIESLLKEKTLADVLDEINETMEIDNKQVVFQKNDAKLELSIKDDRIVYALWLPTRVEGEELAQPYAGSIPTRFGYIYKFARDFADFQASTRALEWATIRNIYYSELPTFGWLAGCGKTIFLSPEETSRIMTGVTRYTLANIKWWQSGGEAYGPVMAIPELNGNEYPDLKPELHLPDGFRIEGGTIFIGPAEPVARFPGPITFIAQICLQWYNIGYSFEYSPILTVYDDLAGNWANFAFLIGIDDNRPAESCGIIYTPIALCENPDKPVKIKVIDNNTGEPIPGARISYEGCIFTTDQNGVAEGMVSADSGTLQVSAEEYGVFRQEVSAQDLQDFTVRFVSPVKVTFKFFDDFDCQHPTDQEAIMLLLNSTDGSNQYVVTNYELTEEIDCEELSTRQCMEKMGNAIKFKQDVTENIVPGTYTVSARYWDKEASSNIGEYHDVDKIFRGFWIETDPIQIEIPPFDVNIRIKVSDSGKIISMAEDRMHAAKDSCCDDYHDAHPGKKCDHEECAQVGVAEATGWLSNCRNQKSLVLIPSERCSEESAESGILKKCQEKFKECGGFWVEKPGCIPRVGESCKEPCNLTCMKYIGCFNASNNFSIYDFCKNPESDLIKDCVRNSEKCLDWEMGRIWCGSRSYSDYEYFPSYGTPGYKIPTAEGWRCRCPYLPLECFDIKGCFDTTYKSICRIEECG